MTKAPIVATSLIVVIFVRATTSRLRDRIGRVTSALALSNMRNNAGITLGPVGCFLGSVSTTSAHRKHARSIRSASQLRRVALSSSPMRRAPAVLGVRGPVRVGLPTLGLSKLCDWRGWPLYAGDIGATSTVATGTELERYPGSRLRSTVHSDSSRVQLSAVFVPHLLEGSHRSGWISSGVVGRAALSDQRGSRGDGGDADGRNGRPASPGQGSVPASDVTPGEP